MTRRSSAEGKRTSARGIARASVFAMVGLATVLGRRTAAEQPPAPCHPNPRAAVDMETVANRGDIRHLPDPLKERLVRLASRPHTYLPMQAFDEADQPDQLFQYYLLDTTG